jgi:hypothetical protein
LGDHAAPRVLGDGAGAGRTIMAHAGEHDAERRRPEGRGHAGEQGINRRAAEMNRRLVADAESRVGGAHDRHVMIAQRYIDRAGFERLVLGPFLGLASGGARQTLGMPVKTGGMCCATTTGIRDNDADAAPSRALSACGPPVELPMAIMRGGTSEKGRCLKASFLSAGAASPVPSLTLLNAACCVRTRPSNLILRMTSRRKSSEVVNFTVCVGLRHIVQRAERERLKADLGVAPGQGGDHQHA